MLRELVREAVGSVGRVVTYADVEEARAALLHNPPKVFVLGGAPVDPAILELLKKAISAHGVIGLALADSHDLQLALQAGVVEGFPRSPEGLRQLAMRLRPLLAPSLRPPPGASSMRPQSGARTWPSKPGQDEADLAPQCALIVLGSFAAHGDAVAYLMSRLPNNLPGVVLVHGHTQPDSELKELLTDETSWRVRSAGEPGPITPGSVWIAHRSSSWLPRLGADGVELVRATPAAPSGGRSTRPAALAGIDTFFEAIAQTLGSRALGAVLGATGDEGSYGLWALRNAGSYTLAQRDPGANPQDTRSPVAHEVLGLETLPQAIAAYCQRHNSYRSIRPSSS